jgi:hypothetical protein
MWRSIFPLMTLAAEQVMREIRGLPREELREIWRQLGQLVVETPATNASDVEFETALDEVTGCTARRNATGRLLEERQRERQREQDQLQARAGSRSHA